MKLDEIADEMKVSGERVRQLESLGLRKLRAILLENGEIDFHKLDKLAGINLNGKTILIATHDINNLEEKFDEVLCLNRHCCAFGDPSEVLTEEVIKEMYGSHNEMFKNHIKESHGIKNDN